MKTSPEELSHQTRNDGQLRRKSLVLVILALLPFVLIFFLDWANRFGYYLHPLIVIGLCFIGAVFLSAVCLAGIISVSRNYHGEGFKRIGAFLLLGVVGMIAVVTFMWITYSYVLDTYMHN